MVPKHALRLGLSLSGVLLLAIGAGGSSAAETHLAKRVAAPTSVGRADIEGTLANDQVIVRFKAGTTAAERSDALDEVDATVDRTLLPRMQVVDLPDDVAVGEAVGTLEANPDVAYAEPNFERKAAAIPNDPEYPELWALPKMGMPAAWDLATGSTSVIVAVIDTGVAYDHPDLAPNIWTNDDPAGGGDSDGNGFVDDTHGWDFVQEDAVPLDFHYHGTHVAGTIGAKGNNNLGLPGVNWDVSLMPVRAGDFYGSFDSSDTIAAYTYACQNGARVVNGSFGGPGFSQAELDAINSPACANTLFVFAAGNDGYNMDTVGPLEYPCAYNTARIICVAASNETDGRASFSNYGATSVDIAAPGTDIFSASPVWDFVGQLESFEDPGFGARWALPTATNGGPLWGRTAEFKSAATFSLADSPSVVTGTPIPYANNTINQVVNDLELADLTGKRGCFLQYDLRHDIDVGDFLRIYGGTTNVPAAITTEIVSLWSISPSTEFVLVQDDLSMFDGAPAVYLKVQLESNNDGNVGDGAFLDAVGAVCLDPGVENYQRLDGTSMAAPQVSGVAALMIARNPDLTVTQTRNIILATANTVPGFSVPVPLVATGARLDALDAVEHAVLPPAPTIGLGPSGSVSSTAATFAFTGEVGAVECRLDAAPFAQCVSPVDYTGLAQGEHTFRVRATSPAGPSDTTTRVWTVDTIAPAAPTIDSGPTGAVSSTTATFTISNVEGGLTFECSLDGGAFAVCSSPAVFNGLSEAPHTLDVRAKDAAGNTSGTTSRNWIVSLVDTPTIDSGPSGAVSSTAASFAFTDVEGGTTLECSLDAAPFAVCTSPRNYSSLAQGSHTFQVHAVNGLGSVSDPASRTWTVDTVDPVAPTIDTGPTGLVASTAASFTFSNVEGGLVFECKLDSDPFAACTSPVDLTSLGQGSHTFQIRAKDAAGNTSPAASRTWTVDTVAPPTPTIDTGPTGTVASTSASFGFTATEIIECRIDSDPFAACSSPAGYSSLAQGAHTFEVRASDLAGNMSGVASRTWTVDTVAPPAPTIDSGPTGFVSSTAASFTFSDTEAGAVLECRLDSDPFAVCTSPANYTGLSQGAHTFDVRAKDAVSNTSATTSRTWTADTVAPPVPTIDSGPTGTVASTAASLAFSDTEGGVTLECRLDGAAFGACTSPADYTSLAQGAHTFDVRASDAAGNTSSAASRTWTVDTVAPPDPTIDSGPTGAVSSTSASFAFSDTEAGAVLECRLDSDPFAVCTSPADYTGLAQGSHTFDVRAKDAVSNTSGTTSRTWTVDTIAPADPTIDTGPSGTVASTSAAFEFSGTETLECRIDGGSYATCSSPKSYTSLGQGSHTFDLRATDAAGNASGTASRTWTVDTVAPPVPTIDSGPTGTVASTDASFTFSDTEGGAVLECRVDSDPFAVCTSPTDYTSLAQGAHTFDVRAKDSVGNTSAAASRTWTADTVAPPAPTINSGPANGSFVSSTSPSFGFSDTEAGVVFECSLDSGSFDVCTSPAGYTVGQGAHTFDVRAKDSVGNTSGATSRAWTVDTVAPPIPTIDSGPNGTVASTSAAFTFSDTEGGVTLECKLDTAAFAPCTSPADLTLLAQGAHTFEVQAKDAAGNTASTSRAWSVDTVAPPVPTINSGPSGSVNTGSATFTFSDTEAGVVFECRRNADPFAVCTSPVGYGALAEGAHSFDLRAKDALGNTSTTVTRNWTVDTVAPADPTIDTGPTGTVATTAATFTFSGEAGATFECALDAGAFAACTTPRVLLGLAQGAHSFQVQAKDAAGNVSAGAASRAWSVDTVAPPAPTFSSGPTGSVKSTAASFAFADTEPGVSFECRLDGAAYAPCTSPVAFTALTQGLHTFNVRVTDGAGNISTAAARTWTVDTVAPNTTITAGPKTGTATTATFKFTSNEAGATFKCKLDKGAWAICKTGKVYKKLKKGSHTFQVAATDKAGNLDKTPAKKTWKIV